MISVFQFRAARSGIDITLEDLSKITKVRYDILVGIEKGPVFEIPKISKSTQKKITNFYNSCGVKFIENNLIVIDFRNH